MFSIIIPLYNKAQYVFKCIESVMNQSFRDFELIIINDGSTDNSMGVVKLFKDSRIKVIEQNNSGVSSARNYGVKVAKNDFIAFLDADDWWSPNYLEEIHGLIRKYPKAGLWAAKYYKVRNGHNIEANIGLENNFQDGYINYIKSYTETMWMPVTSSSFVSRKPVFDEFGGFNPELRIGEDFDLWIRIALKYKIAFFNKPLVYYNQDVNIQNRAIGGLKIYKPENHYIFHLDNLKEQEKSNPELKQLLDKLRLRALFRYHVKRKYPKETKQIIKEINFKVQPLSWRMKYKLPVWLVRTWLKFRGNLSGIKNHIKRLF